MTTLALRPSAVRWFNGILASAQSSIYAQEEIITPEKAAVLLSRNPDNRNIRPSKAAQYVADMKEGKFVFNGETIIVSKDGLLNDGQHRLYACVVSGQSFRTMLIVGVARETRYTIDTGAAKGAGDHLSFQKFANPNTSAAIARFVIVWEQTKTLGRRSQVSAQQQIERVKSDVLLREVAAWVDSARAKMKNILKGAILGFLFYEFAKQAPTEAKRFMDSLRDGANLPAKSPIYLLREKLMQDKRLNDMEKVEAVIRAWNHWCSSEETKISRLVITGEVPEIGKPRAKRGVITTPDTSVAPDTALMGEAPIDTKALAEPA